MFKKILFQMHWLLGISAGLVLAVVGVSGAMLSFEREILLMLNPQVMRVAAPESGNFSLQELLGNLAQAEPDKRIASITLQSDPKRAARVGFAHAPTSKIKKGLDWYYVDPYSGTILGKARGEPFFSFVMKLHRWLALDEIGKQIVGASTVALIFFCLSGLYLRWPRSVKNWRTWLCFSFKRTGRSFLWEIHSVVGTWCLIFYLVAALTGLYWSYDWYRAMLFNLAGVPKPTSSASKIVPTKNQFNSDVIWSAFLNNAGNYQTATLRLPETPTSPVEITYLPESAPHERATNKLLLNQQTGAVIKQDNYQERSAGQRFINSIYALHTGSYFGVTGLILMMLASLTMPLFAITGWLLYLDRRAKKRALAITKKVLPKSTRIPELLIGFASQTGFAEQLAWRTANVLRTAGMAVTVQPLSAINVANLGNFQRALFVVSTFGEGGPPDSARHFAKLLNQVQTHSLTPHPQSLTHLRFGLLALGDQQYRSFCQFGRQIEQWLHSHGATSLFKRIDVHQQDPYALQLWDQQLAELAPISATPLFDDQSFSEWTLRARHCLNQGSQGSPTYHVEFDIQPTAHWQAGDLFEILLPDNKIRPYSIASHRSDGSLFLLIREVHHQGQLGAASSTLLHQLPIGASIRARIKSNSSFHLAPNSAGLILIGNGTGLAGLRSHLKARIEQGQQRNWLIFGERNQQHDGYYEEDLLAWQKHGWIAQLDLVFSRDLATAPFENQIYVQHRLQFYAQQVRDWITNGASIVVSGSMQGMGSEVDEVLRTILGTAQVDQLIEQRRYLRDVY